MSELSDRLRRAVGERTIAMVLGDLEAAGHPLGQNTVARFLRGDHGPKPSGKVLEAFAETYGIDAGELRELAGRPRGAGEWKLPDEAASLTKWQQEALSELIRAMVKGEHDGRQPEDEKNPDGGGTVTELRAVPERRVAKRPSKSEQERRRQRDDT